MICKTDIKKVKSLGKLDLAIRISQPTRSKKGPAPGAVVAIANENDSCLHLVLDGLVRMADVTDCNGRELDWRLDALTILRH